MMSIVEIGCCGAVCKTCPPYITKYCRGCKLGYDNGARKLSRAKYVIKVCCMKRNLDTCGDCGEYISCIKIQGLYAKKGYKYKKYKESMEYIRKNGYEAFLQKIKLWKRAY